MSDPISIDVFRAVADPTRRAILDMLAEQAQAVSDLLIPFPISQPALSKHLRILREAGLVRPRKEGRQRIYELRADGLKSIAEWVVHYQQFWNEKLDALSDLLDEDS